MHRKSEGTYQARFLAWVAGETFRYANNAGLAELNEETATQIVTSLFDHARTVDAYELATGNDSKGVHLHRGFNVDDLEGKIAYAARFAVEHFDPEEIERRRKGGRNSKRGPSFHIADLKGLHGATKVQVAQVLGSSPRTAATRISEVKEAMRELRDHYPKTIKASHLWDFACRAAKIANRAKARFVSMWIITSRRDAVKASCDHAAAQLRKGVAPWPTYEGTRPLSLGEMKQSFAT